MGRRWGAVLFVFAAWAAAGSAPAGAAPALEAGAGRADITPPTGYYMMGWVRSDAVAEGQHTRLFARTLVLRRGGSKVALVAVDLGSIPNGLVVHIAERLAERGFSERDLVISASHTHSGPAGYFNFPAFNTVAPTSTTPTDFELGNSADPQLYSFLARRIAASIRRADRDLGPARAGWGATRLLGVTRNRSVEAHLAGHGIMREFGQGSAELDPLGHQHTIGPDVNVLRVDKRLGGEWAPIGIWSTFSNHGTVVKPSFTYYNGDHHGAATRLAERQIRRRGGTPRRQEVVNAYGNTDEGDASAGLDDGGPAHAHAVGRAEARAMVAAWRRARSELTRRPALARRWTRVCFCGRRTAAGEVSERAVVGLPFLTGSEENRGPLYDITGVPFEGYRLPVGIGPHGVKIQTVPDPGNGTFPTAVPLSAVQVADRAIVTVPGEMTSGMGKRLRAAVLRAGRSGGIRRVVISGLANDFIQYFTSPQEYDRQHYEGGSTLFGRASGVFLEEHLAELVRRIAAGEGAPAPDPFDPRNGVADNAPPFEPGAASGEIGAQPDAAQRLGKATVRWRGGPRGLDRPLDRPFVRVKRRDGGKWRRIDDDLGLRILWSVDEDRYEARWEPGLGARRGAHRFVITANRYRLASAPFRLAAARSLRAVAAARSPGVAALSLRYPRAREDEDLTARPRRALGGRIVARVDGERRVLRWDGRELTLRGRPGARVTVRPGDGADRHGNRNANRLDFTL